MTVWRFRPPLWSILLLSLGLVITVSLGRWQLNRAEQKQALQQAYLLAEKLQPKVIRQIADLAGLPDYSKVLVTGKFHENQRVLIDNRIQNGRAGYHVIAPLFLEGGGSVLVNRGWVARSGLATDLPAVNTPQGNITVVGSVWPLVGRHLELGASSTGLVWQNITVERVVQAFGAQVPMRLVMQSNDTGDGLVRVWEKPDYGQEKHLSYAGQWFLLCATMIVIWVVLNVRRQ